jgi:hypothetical protein
VPLISRSELLKSLQCLDENLEKNGWWRYHGIEGDTYYITYIYIYVYISYIYIDMDITIYKYIYNYMDSLLINSDIIDGKIFLAKNNIGVSVSGLSKRNWWGRINHFIRI